MSQEEKTRRVALVTGASSGIGATYAQRLAARGYDLILVARRADRLEGLARELREKHGVSVEALAADLSSDADCARVVGRINESPNLEFLVNGAGFGSLRRFWNADLDVQERMHRVHVLATMRLCHAALRGMIARKKGFIVNVSSVAAFMQYPGSVSYCATKAWMNSFTQGLHIELRGQGTGVRVQALCPGYTYTEFHDALNLDRSFAPRSWWMTAEKVVDDSLRGLERDTWLVIPGWRYKLIVFAVKTIPRSLLAALAPKGTQHRDRYVKSPG